MFKIYLFFSQTTWWIIFLFNSVQDGVRYYNRAVFDIGDVIGASGGSDETHSLTVQFEAVYVSLGTNTLSSTYWLSVGLEYNSGVYIWIAQCSITLQGPAVSVYDWMSVILHLCWLNHFFRNTLTTRRLLIFHLFFQENPGTTPNFNIEFVGDNLISDDGEEQSVELTFGLPNPKANVTVEIVSLNDTNCALVIQSLNMTSVGSAYQYAVEPSLFSVSGENECCPTSLSLEITDLINKGVAINYFSVLK